MKILSNSGGLAETNCYLVIDEASGVGAMIDAPEGTTGPLLEEAKRSGVQVAYLLLTHGHWDHISDHKVVTDAFPEAQALISRLEEPRLIKPGTMGYFVLPYEIPPRKADAYVEDGQVVQVGGIGLRAIATPGHAAGHMCYYASPAGGKPGVLFSGDLLMGGSVGRYDFADGDIEQLKESLRKVLALPDDTVVLSGHGEPTTVGNEKNGNAFVRGWKLF